MTCHIKNELTVLPSVCDNTAKISIPSIFSVFMDIAAEHAQILGVGSDEMQEKNLFWLTAKTKIKIHRRPEMMKRITVQTWPEPAERIRANRYYTLSCGDEILVEGKSEWTIIGTEDGKLHRIDEVFPSGIEYYGNKVCDKPFARMSDNFSDGEEKGTYTVRSTDIDLGQHMNNASYIRAIFGMFSCKEIEAIKITEVEIHFKAPCFEGEKLSVKIKKTDGETMISMIKEDGKTAVLARLS